jgi:DNA-binding MarR family transcriptional regulator
VTDEIPFRFDSPGASPGFLLWRLTAQWQRQQRAALEPLDLTHVQFVLMASLAWLAKEGEPVNQAQLAQHAGLDVMTTSEVLRILERKALITRIPHPQDSRAKALALTAEGTDRTSRAVPIVEQVDHEFFAALGDDLPQFIAMMAQITR